MSVLKKQFVEKDVQRLRNIVRVKYGEKTHSGRKGKPLSDG